MFLRFRFPAFGMLLFAIACGDHNDPADAVSGPTPAAPPTAVDRVSGSEQAQVRNERLARRFAMALQDDGFRKTVFDEIHASQFREHKVHLQRFVRANPEARPRLARASGDAEADIQRDLNAAPQIEIYFPVKEHFTKWEGDLHLLVATALRDAGTPVAFDPAGHRILLDPKGPPATPVIALGHAELDFDHPLTENLLGGGGGGGGGSPPIPGLYMTAANFYSTFEGWLKGDPEFEVHVLGQDGSTANLKDYQCAGEKAGGAYNYDQNEVNWTGSVLLFSQTQLDQYKLQHPGQALRIVVLEDDDTACVIKTDQNRLQAVFQGIDGAYTVFKNGGITLGNVFKAGSVLEKLFAAVASWILTNDDIVGQAVEDVAAAGVNPSDNWIVKGDNLVTTGAIRLEMR